MNHDTGPTLLDIQAEAVAVVEKIFAKGQREGLMRGRLPNASGCSRIGYLGVAPNLY